MVKVAGWRGRGLDPQVHKRRWLTALILMGVVVPWIALGGRTGFLLLLVLMVFLSLWEFYGMGLGDVPKGVRVGWSTVGLFLPLGAYLGETFLLMSLTLVLLVSMSLFMVLKRETGGVVVELGSILMGVLYASLLPSYFMLIRGLEWGLYWIFLTMAITALGDTAAYYVGSAIGRHRLHSMISPNKTLEGSLAGLVGNVVGALSFKVLFFPQVGLIEAVYVALLVGVAGQVGDLCESMLKRGVGLKDTGRLLPGHGGVLDRLDSLFFSAPVVYYYARYMI